MSAPNVPTSEARTACLRSRWARTGLVLLICLSALSAWVLVPRLMDVSEAAPETDAAAGKSLTPATPAAEELTPEQRQRKLVQGTWEDFYQGHRLLTIREDGTALMVVELAGMGATLFAPKLEFDIRWTMENGRVVLKTTGGRPEGKTGLILKIYGEKAEYFLDALDENHLLLRDVENGKKFEWTHPTSTATTASKPTGAVAPK